MITLAKKGDKPALVRANAFILKPEILPKLFGAFANRYAERPGGYTRIHKFGNRPGDNAPHAILELVDNPRDIRTEMTARAIGWEMLRDKLQSQRPVSIINSGAKGVDELIAKERGLAYGAEGVLRPKTRWNLQKVLRFRDPGAPLELGQKAARHMVRIFLQGKCTWNLTVITCLGHIIGYTSSLQVYRRGYHGGG